MKSIPRICAALLTCTLLSSAAIAEEEASDFEVLNKFPVLAGEEFKQVLFSARMRENINPDGVSWEIHNPFRDKTIAGIVLSIEWKGAGSTQPTTVDVFIRATCLPLSSNGGHESFFKAEEARKASAQVTLKEVRYAAVVK